MEEILWVAGFSPYKKFVLFFLDKGKITLFCRNKGKYEGKQKKTYPVL